MHEGLLTHASVAPPGLAPLDLRELVAVARYLLAERAVQHALPENILEFSTGTQPLLWADLLHQAATTL